MGEIIKKQWQAKGTILIFALLTLWWWFSPQFKPAGVDRYFGDFGSIYGIMALWGAIWGISISKLWGFTGSVMGRAIITFSCGLLAQVFGQVIYAYYSFFKNVQVPYPSFGDIGYFGSIPLYIYGVILLAKVSGVTFGLKSIKSKLQAVVIPVLILAIGYLLFLQGYEFDWSSPLRIFLDFGYPFGQAIYISLALLTFLLSRGILGGIMRSKILFILFALSMQFIADYTFLYQSSRGIWEVGGINDYMYLVAYFIMTLALIQLESINNKLRA